MNGLFFNSRNSPTFAQVTNSSSSPVISVVQAQNAATNGKYYIMTTGIISIPKSGFMCIQISNPIDSASNLHLNRITAGTDAATEGFILFGATFSDAGTVIVPINSNANYSSVKSSMNCKYIASASNPTTGGTVLTTLVTPTTGGFYDLQFPDIFIVGPGGILYLKFQNDTNLTINNIFLNMGWWED